MSQAPVYEIYGLRVRSEILLPARVNQDGRPENITVVCGEPRPVPAEPGPGKAIASFSFGNSIGFTYSETEAGFLLRHNSLCDFAVSRDLRYIEACPDPAASSEMVGLLLGGGVLAFWLLLTGDCVLHASAVELDGLAFGFVGGSGAGKSTVAAIACAGGGSLLTDDVLRVDFRGEDAFVFPGPVEIPLRPSATSLAEHFAVKSERPAADGRIAVHPRISTASLLPLRALFMPAPSRSANRIRIERLGAQEATVGLCVNPRILGWKEPVGVEEQFRNCARIARTVPTYRLEVPWGPPFDSDLPTALTTTMNEITACAEGAGHDLTAAAR